MPDVVWYNWNWDLVAGICSGIYQGCVWTFALQLARGALHATGFQIGLATSAPCIGYLFATLWARQMEGKSKLPFVTITWVLSRGLFVLTPLLVGNPPNRAMFVMLICLAPIVFSVSTPAYTAIMKDIYPDEMRGRLMSFVRVGMAISMLLTAPAMGWLQEKMGLDFRWMFAFGGVFGVGTAFAFSHLRLPDVPNTSTPPPVAAFMRDTFGILVHDRGYRWFQVSVVISGFGNLVACTLYPIYQVDHFHISPQQIANLTLETGIASLLSLFFFGWFMDRFGSLSAVLLGVAIICLTPICYAFGPTIYWLYAGAFFMGFAGAGTELGYLNTTLMFAARGRAAQYQAVHSSLFGLRGTIAPLVAIRLFDLLGKSFPVTFMVCLSIMFLGVVFQVVSMQSYRRAHIAKARAA